jgi:hypothetical protein
VAGFVEVSARHVAADLALVLPHLALVLVDLVGALGRCHARGQHNGGGGRGEQQFTHDGFLSSISRRFPGGGNVAASGMNRPATARKALVKKRAAAQAVAALLWKAPIFPLGSSPARLRAAPKRLSFSTGPIGP